MMRAALFLSVSGTDFGSLQTPTNSEAMPSASGPKRTTKVFKWEDNKCSN